jgi:hypothetical protein
MDSGHTRNSENSKYIEILNLLNRYAITHHSKQGPNDNRRIGPYNNPAASFPVELHVLGFIPIFW